MTPPRRTSSELDGNSRSGDTFDPTAAITDLRGRMQNGEKDIDELRKEMREGFEARKTSQDALERRLESRDQERHKLDREIFERMGAIGTMQKVIVTLVSIVLASLVGLAFVALKH